MVEDLGELLSTRYYHVVEKEGYPARKPDFSTNTAELQVYKDCF
jgi:hypothetical protein